mgnify:CR=1 FL=1
MSTPPTTVRRKLLQQHGDNLATLHELHQERRRTLTAQASLRSLNVALQHSQDRRGEQEKDIARLQRARQVMRFLFPRTFDLLIAHCRSSTAL